MMLETDRLYALRQAMMAWRNGGTISVSGVYGGLSDKFPFGSVVNRSLQIKTGQAHVQRYMRPLLARIQNGEIDPSFVIIHCLRLQGAPKGYEMFLHKEDGCSKWSDPISTETDSGGMTGWPRARRLPCLGSVRLDTLADLSPRSGTFGTYLAALR